MNQSVNYLSMEEKNDDMIEDIKVNINVSTIGTELYLKCAKLNISLAFISQTYFKVRKDMTKRDTLFYHETQKKENSNR